MEVKSLLIFSLRNLFMCKTQIMMTTCFLKRNDLSLIDMNLMDLSWMCMPSGPSRLFVDKSGHV